MLSSTGRLSRRAFLLAAAFLLLLAAGYEAGVVGVLHWRLGWIAYPALLFPTACILSKRLHDRGRAGWWAFVVVGALIAVWPSPQTPVGYVGAAILALGFVELGLRPGEPGPNRFGSNPRA